MDIRNKIALITGASEGIGRATAQALAREGATVVLAARSKEGLLKVAAELPNAMTIPTDMRNPEEVRRLIEKTVEHYGKIDILVNNAGQGIYGPIESINIDAYKTVMELNVYAVLQAMQLVIPVMRKHGGGTILNVSSMVSKMHIPGLAAYASTKYALNALSLTARKELEHDNITVSVMYPKMTATNFGVNAVGARRDARTTGERSPDIDTAEDVAEKIVELIKSGEAEAQM